MTPSSAGASGPHPRPLTPNEAAVLGAFLAFDFPGVEELRVQARSVQVTGGCQCGCGTVDLQPFGEDVPRSAATSPVEITGDIRDAEGDVVGGLILFVHDGLLSLLEVYTYTDQRLAIPQLDIIAWRR